MTAPTAARVNADEMVQAKRTFVLGIVRIKEGQILRGDDDIVKTKPGLFTPLAPRGAAQERA